MNPVGGVGEERRSLPPTFIELNPVGGVGEERRSLPPTSI
jgi:hypothetical protein